MHISIAKKARILLLLFGWGNAYGMTQQSHTDLVQRKKPIFYLKADTQEVEIPEDLVSTSLFLSDSAIMEKPPYKFRIVWLPKLKKSLSELVVQAKSFNSLSSSKNSIKINTFGVYFDIKKLLPGYPIDPESLPKLIDLWNKAKSGQVLTLEQELKNLPFNLWRSIVYLTDFLQIKPLYQPIRNSLLPTIIHNTKSSEIDQLLKQLAIFNDGLLKNELIKKYTWLTWIIFPPRTLMGHTRLISTLGITPDGTTVITGSWDNTVKVWDIATGNLVHTLTNHTDRISTLAITPDGTKVITGAEDKTAKIWDIATGNLVHTLTGHTGTITSLAITPDGTKAITGSRDKTAKIWDIATGNLMHTLTGHTGTITSLAITPDGTKAITGSGDKTAKIWGIANGNLVHTFTGHTGRISSLAITPDGTKAITGSRDKTANIWDIATGNLVHTLANHTDGISTLAITPDSTKVITGAEDKTAKIWGIANGNLVHTFTGHTGRISSLAITPDGTKAITGSWDKTAKIWNIATGNLVHSLTDHTNSIISLEITPDGTHIITGSTDQSAKIWGRDISDLSLQQLLVIGILETLREHGKKTSDPWVQETVDTMAPAWQRFFESQIINLWYKPRHWLTTIKSLIRLYNNKDLPKRHLFQTIFMPSSGI